MRQNMEDFIDQFLEENKLYRFEGEKGVENLAKVVNALGYKHWQQYGQLRGGACVGDILEFLGDNPGAIEAMVEWIKERHSPEWAESIKSKLQTVPTDDDEDDIAP